MLDSKLYDNRIKLQNLRKSVGDRHPAAKVASNEIELYSSELESLLRQRSSLQSAEVAKAAARVKSDKVEPL